MQAVTEASGTEIKPGELWDVFTRTYLPDDAGIRLLSTEVSSGGERGTSVAAQVLVDGHHRTIWARATVRWPPSSTACEPSWASRWPFEDYHEHALTAGSEASAVAYVQATGAGGERTWGVGIDSSILDASLHAVISAANRLRDRDEAGRVESRQ